MKGNIKESCKRWLKDKGMEKWLQRDNLVILVLAGILLFIIALPTKSSDKSPDVKQDGKGGNYAFLDENQANSAQSSADFGISPSYAGLSEEAYTKKLERELEEVLSNAYGVGKVRAMITLSCSSEIVIEKDEGYQRSQTNEEDSEGGSRIVTQMQQQESTVYQTYGSNSEPYVVKTLLPKVNGVVVVAEGAGKGSVDKNITEIVQALFDLEANEVKVVKMQETN